MKRIASLLKMGVMLSLFCSTLFAQGPDTLWTRTYGGAGTDRTQSAQQTTDNGYIIAGWTNSFGAGNFDVYFIKTDALGDTLWTRTYGGAVIDIGYAVQQTTDDGYVIAGYTNSFAAGGPDVYLIKTDANGDTLWTKTYGGIGYEHGRSVQQTTDGGYIVAGNTNSFGAGDYDVWVLRTDALGDTLWTRTYGGAGTEYGYSVQQTTDDGYIIAGMTNSFGAGGYDVYLIKTDALGDTLWTRTYGGAGTEYSYSVQQTTDSGYIVAGRTTSFGAGGNDVYLIKTDALGDTLWTRTYGGTGTEYGYSVQQTVDNGYIIAGYTTSFGAGDDDVYLIKTDALGDTLWTITYGGTGAETGQSVQQTTDNGYMIIGSTNSFGAGGYDVWLLKIAGEPGIQETDGGVIPASHVLSESFPNPFRAETQIRYQLPRPGFVTVAIYDLSGQRIKTLVNEHRDAGYYAVRWDGRSQDGKTVSNGVYFCRMKAGTYTAVKKILLLR
jgi:hypothetical protein